jgi:hypothetical protein
MGDEATDGRAGQVGQGGRGKCPIVTTTALDQTVKGGNGREGGKAESGFLRR